MKGFGETNKPKKKKVKTNSISLSKEQLINQAINFHLQGNISEAFKLYNYCINKGFNDHRVFSNYGAILKDLGKFQEAEFYLRKAVKLNPNVENYHYNLGLVLKDVGKLEEAEISTRKAIKIKSDDAEAHSNLGTILKDLGKLEEAEISIRKGIQLNPSLAEAHSNLGTILKDQGKLEEARNCYSKAISLKPDNTTFKMNRSKLYFDSEQFELALQDSDSLNSKESRAFSLTILYALGKIDEIYKRIEKTSKIDEENIMMAAFSSFIAEQEKKDTYNNFCRNPLFFLYFSNLSFHVGENSEFIQRIINELNELETVWDPANKATKKGFQTPAHINLFFNSPKYISELKKIIFNELDKYYLKYKEEDCTYIQKWPSKKDLNGWHVILKKQGYQEAHNHPAGWLSGVIYLKVVPPLGIDEGAIEFSLNGVNYSNPNSPQLVYKPKQGDIILFPSSLHHRTIPFSTDTERIVVAFDLLPNHSS